MPFGRRKIAGISAQNFDMKRYNRFLRDDFGVQPAAIKNDGTTAASGTTGDTNILTSAKGQYEYFILGAGQTIKVPVWVAASGLNIALDATDDEGLELTAGIGALSSGSFTIGTDRAFYVKATLKSTDASGSDELLVGFRKNQAYQTAYTSYTDYAAIGLVTSADPGAISIKTRLNSGSAVTQDTTATWADSATKTFKVVVLDDGYVRFYLNEADPPVTITNFQFDTGDVVNWFVRHLHAADVTDALYLTPQTLTVNGVSVYQPALEYGYLRRNGE